MLVGGRAVNVIGAGDGFGEIALLNDVPRTATVRALTEVELFVLDRAPFLEAVTGQPRSRAAAQALVEERLATDRRVAEGPGLTGAPGRGGILGRGLRQLDPRPRRRHAARPRLAPDPRPRPGRPPAAAAREARDAQPRRIGEGPDRAADDRGRRARRPPAAGRHDHRADERQHRPRPRDRRRAQGLPLHLRHGRQAVRREAGAAARVRRRGRAVPHERAPGVARVLLLGGRRLARDIPGAFKPDQYCNAENPTRARADDRPRDLGPDRGPDHAPRRERRDGRDRPGRRGTSRRRTRIRGHRRRPGGLDPVGRHGARPYLTEGVGEDFLPGTYDPSVVDRWVRVSDRDAFAMARRITREEGILAGESCGTALLAALDEVRTADGGPERPRPPSSS